jgi:hypothetical protein
MEDAIESFKEKLKNESRYQRYKQTHPGLAPGEVAALIFYVGHGCQLDGENYLVPVDHRDGDDSKLVPIKDVLAAARPKRRTGPTICILDASHAKERGPLVPMQDGTKKDMFRCPLSKVVMLDPVYLNEDPCDSEENLLSYATKGERTKGVLDQGWCYERTALIDYCKRIKQSAGGRNAAVGNPRTGEPITCDYDKAQGSLMLAITSHEERKQEILEWTCKSALGPVKKKDLLPETVVIYACEPHQFAASTPTDDAHDYDFHSGQPYEAARAYPRSLNALIRMRRGVDEVLNLMATKVSAKTRNLQLPYRRGKLSIRETDFWVENKNGDGSLVHKKWANGFILNGMLPIDPSRGTGAQYSLPDDERDQFVETGVDDGNDVEMGSSILSSGVAQVVATIVEIMPAIRIGLGIIQILSGIQFSFSVHFPWAFSALIGQLKIFSLDLMGVLNLACIFGEWNFYSHFGLSIMAAPILLGIGFALYSYQLMTIKLRLYQGARMVTEKGEQDREGKKRSTAAADPSAGLLHAGHADAPVLEDEKVNPADFHEHCTICESEYDDTEDGMPRELECGHRFCTNCIRFLLKDSDDKDGDRILLCPRNHIAPDQNWYSPDLATNWSGGGRAGLVLQQEIVGDKAVIRLAEAKVQKAEDAIEAEKLRQATLKEEAQQSEESSSYFVNDILNDMAASTDDVDTMTKEDEEFAKIMKSKKATLKQAKAVLKKAEAETLQQPCKECSGKTVVTDGDVQNLPRVQSLSLVDDTKKDLAQLTGIFTGLFRVGPPGPLDPAFKTEISYRLTNQYLAVMFFFVTALYPVVSQTIFQTVRRAYVLTHAVSTGHLHFVCWCVLVLIRLPACRVLLVVGTYALLSVSLQFLCHELNPGTCQDPNPNPTALECAFPAGENENLDWWVMDKTWTEEDCPAGCEYIEPEILLEADFQVECNDVAHFWLQGFAIIAVLAFPIGVPSALLLILFIHRDELKKEASKARYVQSAPHAIYLLIALCNLQVID